MKNNNNIYVVFFKKKYMYANIIRQKIILKSFNIYIYIWKKKKKNLIIDKNTK